MGVIIDPPNTKPETPPGCNLQLASKPLATRIGSDNSFERGANRMMDQRRLETLRLSKVIQRSNATQT